MLNGKSWSQKVTLYGSIVGFVFCVFFVLEVDGQLEEMESWLFVISFFNIQQRNGRIVELQKKKNQKTKTLRLMNAQICLYF
jgi:hypothetical protein